MNTITETGTQVIDDFVQKIKIVFKEQKLQQQVVKQTTTMQRIEKLKKFREVILRFEDELASALYTDFQRPQAVTYAVEIGALLQQIDFTISNLAEWMKTETVQPTFPSATPYIAKVVYEPKGVVLIIGPWNVPFFLTLYPLISSVAAGNTTIIKPSELTPNTSGVIKKVIAESFNENEVTVFEGGVAETTELLKLPFDHIYFTGSPNVARIVMEAASKNLSSVTLELGGKAPAVIDESADLDKAVFRIIKGKALNAGQICMDVDYILIPEKLQNIFIQKANDYLNATYRLSGDFNYEDYDQIINVPNFNRLKRLFDDAVAHGAKVEIGGVFEENLRKIQPTVLSNLSLDLAIMKEEIFGPLLPIVTYSTKEEAVEIMRNIYKPIGLYIFSEDSQFIEYIIGNTTAGGTSVNDVMLQAFDPALPFGGVNSSGIGKGYGKHGFIEMSNTRGVVYQNPKVPNDEFFKPPYAGKAEIIKGAIK